MLFGLLALSHSVSVWATQNFFFAWGKKLYKKKIINTPKANCLSTKIRLAARLQSSKTLTALKQSRAHTVMWTRVTFLISGPPCWHILWLQVLTPTNHLDIRRPAIYTQWILFTAFPSLILRIAPSEECVWLKWASFQNEPFASQ